MSESYEYNYVEKVKIRVRDLRLGMFICELDRPWLETPFLLQGFELKTPDDIDEVRRYCEYVYVDMLRTRLEEVPIYATSAASFSAKTETRPLGTEARSFGQELGTAETMYHETLNLVGDFIEDARLGSSVDIQMAREAVSGCISSIMRNPDAMLFMTRMQEKSDLISQHALNSCVYAIIVGRAAGLQGSELEEIGTCGLLHDLGQIKVPDKILNKPGPFTPEEVKIVRQHTEFGRDILLSAKKTPKSAAEVAYGHHENVDGSGYPQGLKGADVSLHCRIVAVADKYDAIVSPRPYRPAYSHLDALGMMNRWLKYNQLDSVMTNHFVTYLGIYPPGTIVELSTGEKAIVLETNPNARLRPKILVVRDPQNNPVARFVDMAIKQTDDRDQPYRIKTVHRAGAYGINVLDYRGIVMKALG